MTEQALRPHSQACYHADHLSCGLDGCRCACHASNVVRVKHWPWDDPCGETFYVRGVAGEHTCVRVKGHDGPHQVSGRQR